MYEFNLSKSPDSGVRSADIVAHQVILSTWDLNADSIYGHYPLLIPENPENYPENSEYPENPEYPVNAENPEYPENPENPDNCAFYGIFWIF